jgi:hypothetical protein
LPAVKLEGEADSARIAVVAADDFLEAVMLTFSITAILNTVAV